MEIEVLLLKIRDDVKTPERQTEGSAGMDIHAHIIGRTETIEKYGTKYQVKGNKVLIKPNGRVLIPTGLFVDCPKGYKLSIKPRSGLALRDGITVLNTPGTIDSDYRGEIGVILINHSETVFVVQHGDRIAQVEIENVLQIKWNITESLIETDRGAGGFNSTGKQ